MRPTSSINDHHRSPEAFLDLQKLQRLVVDALEDVKAQDIKVYNTLGLSDMFDRVVLASGTSNRQTRSLAWSVVEKVKEAGGKVISVEGTDPGEWVLVDLGDLVVHIMQPAVRQYYGLEEMWGAKPVRVKLAFDRRGNKPPLDDTLVPVVNDPPQTGVTSARKQALNAAVATKEVSKAAKNTASKPTRKQVGKPAKETLVKEAKKQAAKKAAKATTPAQPAAKKAPLKSAKKTAKKATKAAAKTSTKPKPAAKKAARVANPAVPSVAKRPASSSRAGQGTKRAAKTAGPPKPALGTKSTPGTTGRAAKSARRKAA